MVNSWSILFGKRKYLFALILLVSISVTCVAFSMRDREDFDVSRREVLLRRLGHEILLQSGDRTSRVLPVKKIAEDEYQINFEQELTFNPDSLVNTTRRLLAKDPLARDYVVNVLNCDNSGVAYGYAISQNKKDDIVACSGRLQPKACYRINVQFKPTSINLAKHGYLLGSLPLLAFIGFIFFRSANPKKPLPEEHYTTMFTLGNMVFDADRRTLSTGEHTTDLTKTETRILLVFASSPNEIIERSRLQKEIWEDDGVIVGRSLDMFISKLRKKLELDPNIRITVIRGKGYMLEINS